VGSAALHDDLELYLTGRLRAELSNRDEAAFDGIVVANVFPAATEPWPLRLLVVRDDSGPSTSVVTADRHVGLTLVVDDTAVTPLEASEGARLVAALAYAVPGPQPDNPVAVVRAQNGPYSVAEPPPRLRFYSTITYGVAARPL
jgi:hypothetical protein